MMMVKRPDLGEGLQQIKTKLTNRQALQTSSILAGDSPQLLLTHDDDDDDDDDSKKNTHSVHAHLA